MKRIKSIALLTAVLLAAVLFVVPGVSYAEENVDHRTVTVDSVSKSKRDDGSTQWILQDDEGNTYALDGKVQGKPNEGTAVVLDLDKSKDITGWRIATEDEANEHKMDRIVNTVISVISVIGIVILGLLLVVGVWLAVWG